MFRKLLRLVTLTTAFTLFHSAAAQAPDLGVARADTPIANLEAFREALGTPALAAGVITDDRIQVDAVGVRRLNWPMQVDARDHFHTGSDGKAMFATVAARLVEEGRIRWDSTIAEVFPEFVAHGGQAYRAVTLADLLRHRSGLMALDQVEDLATVPSFRGSAERQRLAFTAWALRTQPVVKPGHAMSYSNAGYVVAAAMVERVTQRSFEELMQRKLFAPLGIDASYEWPAWNALFAQPWGHEFVDGQLHARSPYLPQTQIPIWLRPAAGVSVSTRDFARFVRLHLRGLRGNPALLSYDSFVMLHTPVDGFAMGWAVGQIDGRAVSYHTGASGLFVASALIDATANRAAVVMTNADSAVIEAGVEQIVAYLATVEE